MSLHPSLKKGYGEEKDSGRQIRSAHSGQKKASVKKYARQYFKRKQLAQEAARLSLSVNELRARHYQEVAPFKDHFNPVRLEHLKRGYYRRNYF